MGCRNTKQKQIILDTLEHDKTHPTMYQIYEKIKKKYPDCKLGQATVYRNVNRLVEEGSVRKISLPNAVDCYDGNIREHYHLICEKCGKLIDVFDDEIINYFNTLKKRHNIIINRYLVLLEGVCKKCLEKNTNKEK